MVRAYKPSSLDQSAIGKQTSWITRSLQLYPVSLLMAGPYIAFVLPQAVYYGNPRTSFIIYLVALGLAGSAVVETLFVLLRPPYRSEDDEVRCNNKYPRLPVVAQIVALVGMAADLTKVIAGGGTIEAQLTGRVADSPLVSIVTPLGAWKYMALAMLTAACLSKSISRRRLLVWVGSMLAMQVLTASFTAITAPLISFASFTALSFLMFGLVRARLTLAFAMIVMLLWPTIFTLRNSIREAKGVAVSADLTAQERLRFDEQTSRASYYAVPARIPELIGVDEVIRYGLVPRVLDPNRPILATGGLISDYIGGSRTNMYSFLPLGTLYFLIGPVGIVTFYGGFAFVLILLLRTGRGPGPIRLMIVFVAIAGPLSWTNSYPESLVGFLQSLVSMLPIVLALKKGVTTKSAYASQSQCVS